MSLTPSITPVWELNKIDSAAPQVLEEDSTLYPLSLKPLMVLGSMLWGSVLIRLGKP